MKYTLAIVSSPNNEPRASARADSQPLYALRIDSTRPTMARCAAMIILSSVINVSAIAQTAPQTDDLKVDAPQVINQATEQTFLQEDWKAYQAIHAGNQRLIEGDAASALEAYEYAAQLEPNAPEIPFVQGLAQYAQQDYEAARNSFEKAATAENVQLANDALYSLGTTYHAQALQQSQDPKAAIESLEQALQRYRMVLDQNPQHEQAKDANRKAAAMRRQLREIMQKQEQEQQQKSQDSEEKKDQEKQDQEKSESDKQEKSDQEKDRQQQESDENSEQQESDKQDESAKDAQEKENDQASESSENQEPQDEKEAQEKKEQQASAQKQEETEATKQAKRQLREMMQAMRDRKKNRKQPVQRIPAKPVEKDW